MNFVLSVHSFFIQKSVYSYQYVKVFGFLCAKQCWLPKENAAFFNAAKHAM